MPEENACLELHDPSSATACMDGCEFCGTISGMNEENEMAYHDFCLRCHDGLFEHDGQCVEELPHPRNKLMWCPDEDRFDNCGICRVEWHWDEEDQKYHDNIRCEQCAGGKGMVRDSCKSD